jgi:hypothetical protein
MVTSSTIDLSTTSAILTRIRGQPAAAASVRHNTAPSPEGQEPFLGNSFRARGTPQRALRPRREMRVGDARFLTDVSLIGELIIAAVDTEGKPSLGWRGRRAACKVSEAVTAALPVGAAAARRWRTAR